MIWQEGRALAASESHETTIEVFKELCCVSAVCAEQMLELERKIWCLLLRPRPEELVDQFSCIVALLNPSLSSYRKSIAR